VSILYRALMSTYLECMLGSVWSVYRAVVSVFIERMLVSREYIVQASGVRIFFFEACIGVL